MDDNTKVQLKTLMELLMQCVAQSHQIVNDNVSDYQKEEFLKLTSQMADYETQINRLLSPDDMKTFAA